MERTEEISIELPSSQQRLYESKGLALWAGHSSGEGVPLDFRRGRIFEKNPDGELLAKTKEIAGHFNAFVVSGEGERY